MVFPLTSLEKQMFTALVQYNEDGKTPLEVAIEFDHQWYSGTVRGCLFFSARKNGNIGVTLQ